MCDSYGFFLKIRSRIKIDLLADIRHRERLFVGKYWIKRLLQQAPRMYSRKAADFIFNIIDTSSLMAQGGPDEAALSLLSEFLSDGKEVDVVLYLDRLDLYRVESRDKQSMDALTRVLGPEIWKKVCITLTRGKVWRLLSFSLLSNLFFLFKETISQENLSISTYKYKSRSVSWFFCEYFGFWNSDWYQSTSIWNA